MSERLLTNDGLCSSCMTGVCQCVRGEVDDLRDEIERLRAALVAIEMGLTRGPRLPRTTVRSIATAALRGDR